MFHNEQILTCSRGSLYSEVPWGSLHNEVPCLGVQSLYGEVQSIMGNRNMGPLYTEVSRTTENITFPSLSRGVAKGGLYPVGSLSGRPSRHPPPLYGGDRAIHILL